MLRGGAPMAIAFQRDPPWVRSLMHEAVALHAGADSGLIEEIGRDRLDHAGAAALPANRANRSRRCLIK